MDQIRKKIFLKCRNEDERNLNKIKNYMQNGMRNNIMEIELKDQDIIRYALSETVKKIK